MKPEYKYIAIAPVDDEMRPIIINYRDHVEMTLGLRNPHWAFTTPYVTFHPPVLAPQLDRFLGAIEGPTKTATVSRMHFVHLDVYTRGDLSFVTLPYTVPLGPSGLWWELNQKVMVQPQFVHGVYDYDNTLHTSLAKDIDPAAARRAYRALRQIHVDPADVLIDRIEVHRKSTTPGGTWELVETFPLLPLAKATTQAPS